MHSCCSGDLRQTLQQSSSSCIYISMLRNLSRLKKELKLLAESPGPGVSASPVDDNVFELDALIVGPEDSPYAAGTFRLHLNIPENYPFEPPKAQFMTPIYHPNIDSEGRICLDTLKPQPQGSWAPSITINTLLLSIRLLLMHPNAEDGLVPEITELFRRDYGAYRRNAEQWTLKHGVKVRQAVEETRGSSGGDGGDDGMSSGANNSSRGDAIDSYTVEGTNSNASSDDCKDNITFNNTSHTNTLYNINTTNPTTNITTNSTTAPNSILYTDNTEYEFVADGYTLIGCVPGGSGEVLYIDTGICMDSSGVCKGDAGVIDNEVMNIDSCIDSTAVGCKRQRE